MRRTIGVFVLVAAIGIGTYAVVGNSIDRPSPILTSDAKSVSIEPTSATGAPFMPKPEPNVPPYRVVLIVQNHTSNAPTLPMAALADTLTSRLTGKTFKVINPHNVVGVNQNRTAAGEIMPEASAKELASILGAQGVITASIQEFTKRGIGVPAKAYKLRMRMALNLADGVTGETICGVDGVEDGEDRYLPDELQSDTATLYEGIMHEVAAKLAQKLLAKAAPAEWKPNASNAMKVYLGCNVLGADVRIDGLSRGTCPMALSVTPGVHKLLISYPPYYQDFERLALFNEEGQTYKVVLQITPEGEKVRRSGELFEKQKALIDAELARYKDAGKVEDYVRKTLADGLALYWKNSCQRIIITDGTAENIELATPKMDGGVLQKGQTTDEIGAGLRDLLEMK